MKWTDREGCLVLGMVHLRPLPGASRYGGDFGEVRELALRDAEALLAGGVDGLLVENFHDAPFYPARVPPETVAGMTALAVELRTVCSGPLGINVLRNDGQAALAVAVAAGADFIRVNVLCGARLTDQGILQGIAADLLRDRRRLHAQAVSILADVDVKHSAPLAPRALDEEVRETVERGGADAVIISGPATGLAVDPRQLQLAREAAGDASLLIGSGVRPDTVAELAPLADGMIIGTAFKAPGETAAPVDSERVRELMRRLRSS